ncbi:MULTISPECIES: beta-ketoacyl synthase [unclassified Leeuwenhoekiella]|uniref:beta-ketoacyl-[acyl-carrier-protein] synthase family protein n=1 Tax=unclassified Leeuwenhoekiella TaxID=2615029 RepID=UPI000C3BAD5E|nr:MULTISPECIES: beta-ketoacyl-[acyl-carrier-protein] synthase family protein [unclassified Leeuwenhoekiella]MAW95276.1 beta-ketoacyl-ACP synthase [Leeuwenhoekiella sp.]MBA81801.1 beta-ketoacyl-ACP synthase [Leeuwenhoekiella sp.]|tara:strand:- start:1621 stop:2892 length:1272 start_codon:yes stop_codon:yes gene_type:complete
MQNPRVVVTGLGVCAPNGVGVPAFKEAIEAGKSGIRFYSELEKLKFSCQIGGMPLISEAVKSKYFTPLQLRNFNAAGILYGVAAGVEAWQDAGLEIDEDHCDFDSGTIFGVGTLGVDKYRESIYKVDEGNTRRLGSTSVQQTMSSGVSAYLGGMLGLGNLVTTNSSACTTGTEAVLLAYERIKAGKAKRMLAGSTSDGGPYVWCGFDALRILPSKYNDKPAKASRPMDADASGFVPGSGAGALVLESLESAQDRGATIYAELIGGHSNSGGQRQEGSMTAPNPVAVKHCITEAVRDAGISGEAIDAVNGHLTATSKDDLEIENWSEALGRSGIDFPYINSLKGMTGHCLAASGSIECVASVLQLKHQFLFPNINLDRLHPSIAMRVAESRIPKVKTPAKLNILAKASFGFGDVNCCLIFKKFQ